MDIIGWSAMRSQFAAVALLCLATPAVASAQRAAGPRLGLSQPAQVSHPGWTESFRADSIRPSHWVEGAAIGGGIGFLIGDGLYRFAESEDEGQGVSPLLIVVPTALFTVIGAMIGSFSPRK
jgi:hypothetical protein